ncbi:hypothetical protein GCK72_012812 [Caenorhabditis remanei]|uniref:BTB domain-containing protein n=1 Tax=Caenorhabditis remanei TaxID=31234 RepID=A0A6A5GPG7_CAERE|nr:hypothetical protein GCK72_012812 [Caenorhabditis remanei]KAF1756359.1 hypothetical protein GCK72_012812 [Caenorhabditis remanei]
MLHQDYIGKPNPFLLGSNCRYVDFPIEKKRITYFFCIPTIHNVNWKFTVDTTNSEETNIVKFSISQKKEPKAYGSIELEVGLVVENLESSEHSIRAIGRYEFTKDTNKMIIDIPGYDRIHDGKQGFFDEKAEEKSFKIRCYIVVKSSRLYDSVELFDFYHFDSTIFDVEVNVLGHQMFLSKKLISLQSPHLYHMIESQNIDYSDLPTGCFFHIFHDFLQIIHGVDLQLDNENISEFLDLAYHLEVPRVTEYCKRQMINGLGGMTTNQMVELAEKWSFWDIVPRKLAQALCWADLKAQDWDLDELEKDVIDQITRRLFELNC